MRHLIWVLCLTGCFFSPSALIADEQAGGFELTASGSDDRATSDELQIDRMARFYRIQNYELNRVDRAEYNRRADELQKRIDAWQDSGRNAEQTRELIQWLTGALGASDRPAASRVAPPVETLPTPRTIPSAGVTSPTISPNLAPIFSDKANDVEKPEIDPTDAPAPGDDTTSGVTKHGAAIEPTAPKLSATGDEAATDNSIIGGIRSTIDDLVKRVEQVAPISQMPDSVPPPVTLPALADVPDAPPFVSPAFVPQTVPKLNIDVPKVGGLAEMRGSATRPGSKSATTNTGEEGKVNFTEVAALTRAYNVSLRELETELSKPAAWSADRLEPLVDELDDLARRREDLGLYDNALPAEERSQLAGRDSLDQAIRLMGKRIAEVRKELAEEPEGKEEARRNLAQLDGFSRRLASLAGKK